MFTLAILKTVRSKLSIQMLCSSLLCTPFPSPPVLLLPSMSLPCVVCWPCSYVPVYMRLLPHLVSSFFPPSSIVSCRKFGNELKVCVGNPCTFYVGNKAKELHFQEDQSGRPQIRKGTSQSVILLWPTRLWDWDWRCHYSVMVLFICMHASCDDHVMHDWLSVLYFS